MDCRSVAALEGTVQELGNSMQPEAIRTALRKLAGMLKARLRKPWSDAINEGLHLLHRSKVLRLLHRSKVLFRLFLLGSVFVQLYWSPEGRLVMVHCCLLDRPAH